MCLLSLLTSTCRHGNCLLSLLSLLTRRRLPPSGPAAAARLSKLSKFDAAPNLVTYAAFLSASQDAARCFASPSHNASNVSVRSAGMAGGNVSPRPGKIRGRGGAAP